MSRAVPISLLLISAAMASACQQMPATPSAAAMPSAASPAAAPAPAAAQGPAAAPAARAPVVEFRLAQPEAGPNLQPLQLGDLRLWVLPQPVLTRADLQSVVAVKSNQGQPYVRFAFSQSAVPKLATISQRFRGKYLLLSIDGKLMSAPTIGGEMNDGVLFVPVVSDQQASQVAAAVIGQPVLSPQ